MTGGAEDTRLKGVADACVHCGFCLPTCPTYAELGTETDSPRGRIWMIRALLEERIGPTPTLLDHLDGCLDCRACETACPSGVRYGTLIEGVRARLEPGRRRRLAGRLLRGLGLRALLPSGPRLAALSRLLVAFDRSGLRSLAASSPLLPVRTRELARLAPRPDGAAFTASAPSRFPAHPPRRGRAALFAGCVVDKAMPGLDRATARLLVQNGYEVVVPRGQTCCGALHAHQGDPETARRLASENLAAFERADPDHIVVNSAGCGSKLREYPTLFPDDVDRAARAERFSRRVEDVLELLHREGLRRSPPPVRMRAVYDEPCHLLHAQGISAAPRALLARIPGLEILPLPEADLCCGSAGVYNLTRADMSRRLLARKTDHILSSGAELVVTANPGCMLQLRAGLEARGANLPVVHLVELLAGGPTPPAGE